MNLIAVARRSLLPTIRHDFLASAVVFDEAKTILPMKIFLHRSFHSLDTTMVEVGESNDMAKHRAVWVDTSGIMLEIRSEEHTSELQSRRDLVCRLLLEKKKQEYTTN